MLVRIPMAGKTLSQRGKKAQVTTQFTTSEHEPDVYECSELGISHCEAAQQDSTSLPLLIVHR
jgi:hypothetical protein